MGSPVSAGDKKPREAQFQGPYGAMRQPLFVFWVLLNDGKCHCLIC
jgi:hypothetical protein